MADIRMIFPPRFTKIVVQETEYTPDSNGNIVVVRNHVDSILRMGGKSIPVSAAPAPVVAPKKAAPEAAPVIEAADDNDAVNDSDPIPTPTEDTPRPEMIDWLRQNGVAMSKNASKNVAWNAVQNILSARSE